MEKAERFGNGLKNIPKYARGKGIQPVSASVELLGGQRLNNLALLGSCRAANVLLTLISKQQLFYILFKNTINVVTIRYVVTVPC